MNASRLPLLATLCLLFLGACNEHKNENQAPQAPPGEVWLSTQQVGEAKIAIEPVAVHDVGNGVVTSGKVTFSDLHVSHVFSPVTGRVKRRRSTARASRPRCHRLGRRPGWRRQASTSPLRPARWRRHCRPPSWRP